MRIMIEEADAAVAEAVESSLLASLRETLPQSKNTGFVLSARGDDSRLAGGLTASTSYGWILIKTLWVADDRRKQGIGRSLMREAEARGKALGCHAAWLDTSNPDAMRFYERLGYAEFGVLSNKEGQSPETHQRWFMKKNL